MEIKTFSFDNNGKYEVQKLNKGKNWPVVYLIHNDDELYIGETTNASYRMDQHLKNPAKTHLNTIEILFDDTFNKSVVLDFEQKLIKYCNADKKFKKILKA